MEALELIRKYNVPGPRYTSYPTVPHWQKNPPTEKEWKGRVIKTFNATNTKDGISVYIHLPFCEQLCFYCGCNRMITKNHDKELPYIQALMKEWSKYIKLFPGKPKISEIHLGGGTPTFFSAEHLKTLIKNIFYTSEIAENHSFSFEAHPSSTTEEHLQLLYDLGFRRVSFGIQDFDPVVQKTINRVQTYEEVKAITEKARAIGYDSINYDLIYGLPNQTIDSVTDTLQKVRELRPDRIAFYAYAHTPWLNKNQNLIKENLIPKDERKRILYEKGRALLEEYGYLSIGMDHFALPEDEMYKQYKAGTLHRNFMGYTTTNTKLLIGLGASSISDAWGAYIQNEKNVKEYTKQVMENRLPIIRGHLLSEEDLRIRKHIMNLMCSFKTSFTKEEAHLLGDVAERLEELEADGLVMRFPSGILLSEKGKAFVRNVCMALDGYLWDEKKTEGVKVFSSTV